MSCLQMLQWGRTLETWSVKEVSTDKYESASELSGAGNAIATGSRLAVSGYAGVADEEFIVKHSV